MSEESDKSDTEHSEGNVTSEDEKAASDTEQVEECLKDEVLDDSSEDVSQSKQKKEATEGDSDVDLPTAPFDDFSASDGDDSSKYSLESKQLFPPYRPQELGEEAERTNPRYDYMLKMMKFLRGGDYVATTAVLSKMINMDLRIDQYIYALEDAGGIQVLLNLMEAPFISCQIGAMEIMAKITRIPHIQQITLSMGLGKTASNLLVNKEQDIVTLAIKIIANITQERYGRTSIRKNNAIPYLVLYADIDRRILYSEMGTLSDQDREKAIPALYCVRAMRNLSKCRKGREALYLAGVSGVLYDLMESKDVPLVINALYIFNHCAKNETYKNEFGHYKVHKFMINLLSDSSSSVSSLSAHYLLSVCDNDRVLDDVINSGLLNILMKKANASAADSVPGFYNTAIKIIYKVSRRESILEDLNEKNALSYVFNLVEIPADVDAEKYLWELIADFATYPENWWKIWKFPGIEAKLIYNVQCHMYEDVRGSAARIIGLLVHNNEIYAKISQNDILVKLWSLLLVNSPYTVESACRALLPIMKRTEGLPAKIRKIRSGIFILMNLLESRNPDILAGGILLLGKIIQDKLNLEVLTSMGALDIVFGIITTETYPKIRAALCYLIASLGTHRLLNFQIGHDGYIPIVINDLKSSDLNVKISAAYALWKLSEDPINCVILHTNGVVEMLRKCLLIDNRDLQTAAGGCLYNIRNLAFNAEVRKWIFFNEPLDSDTEAGIKKYHERIIDYELRKEIEVSEVPDKIEKKKIKKKKKPLRHVFEDREEEYSVEDLAIVPKVAEKDEGKKDLWLQWGLVHVAKIWK